MTRNGGPQLQSQGVLWTSEACATGTLFETTCEGDPWVRPLCGLAEARILSEEGYSDSPSRGEVQIREKRANSAKRGTKPGGWIRGNRLGEPVHRSKHAKYK